MFSMTRFRKLKDLLFLLQIYVDEVPLPFPGHALIAVAAAVVLGGLIFTAFIFKIRDIHPRDRYQKLI